MIVSAISTVKGTAAIAVLRTTGKNCLKLLEKIFVPISKKKLEEIPARTAIFGEIFDGKEKVDEVLVVFFEGPNSYTGEDLFEIQCHGGVFLQEKILKLLLKNGSQMAEPGEFSKRAFLNGKLNLFEAEAIMDLISAQSEISLKTALSTKDGAVFKKIKAVTNNLLEVQSRVMAEVDYPEEADKVSRESIIGSLEENKKSLEKITQNYNNGRSYKEGVDVAIVGRPNVGKSSLMNKLLDCERAIVNEIAGTTRDVVEDTAILDGVILRISDTAGIRETKDAVELIGIEKTKEKIYGSALVLAVFDGSFELLGEDLEVIEKLKDVSSKIAIINKVDKRVKLQKNELARKFESIVEVSCTAELGLDELKEEIKKKTNALNFNPAEGRLSNLRQYQAVNECLREIKEAIDDLQNGQPTDVISVMIDSALESLLNLTGENVSEKVVNEIFSRFCLGK